MAKCLRESKVLKIGTERLTRVFQRHPVEGLVIMKRLTGVIAVRFLKSYKEFATTGR